MSKHLGRVYALNPLRDPKLFLLFLSLIVACTTVITFYGWQVLWEWESPLFYSAELILATIGLWSSGRSVRLLSIALCLHISISLGFDMCSEWREYWSAGAGMREAFAQSLSPAWAPLHTTLAITVLIFALTRSKFGKAHPRIS
jgi:hypothetical protein